MGSKGGWNGRIIEVGLNAEKNRKGEKKRNNQIEIKVYHTWWFEITGNDADKVDETRPYIKIQWS